MGNGYCCSRLFFSCRFKGPLYCWQNGILWDKWIVFGSVTKGILSGSSKASLFVHRPFFFIRSWTYNIWGCGSDWMQWSVLGRSDCGMFCELPAVRTFCFRHLGFSFSTKWFYWFRRPNLPVLFWNLSTELICDVSEIILASSGCLNMVFIFKVFESDFAVVPKR